MLYVQEKVVKLGGIYLEGQVTSVEVQEAGSVYVAQDEKGRYKKSQPVGYENAKVMIDILLEDTKTATTLEQLTEMQRLFKPYGQDKPKLLPIVNEDCAVRGITKVYFKNLTSKKVISESKRIASLELWAPDIAGIKLTGEKYMRKSVGIGSQISQISGVYYPTRIDNYCKIVKGMKYYGRYMDDIYIIHEDKEYLKGLLNDIQGICDELGLFINPKKTQIVKLSHGFTFLKIKYNLIETGKVQERISKDSVTRMRRKLKKFRKLMDAGEMSFDDVRCAYASWKGGVSHYDSYNVVKSMDKLFDELFIHPFIEGGHRDEQNKNEQK